MNITFLVGNGFDIASGIDTSYGAFYDWYCDQKTNITHIDNFKKEIKDDIKKGGKDWADFEIGLGQYTKHFTTDNIDEFFECYEDAHDKIIEFLNSQQSKFITDDFDEDELDRFKMGLVNFYQNLTPQERQNFENIMDADKSNNTKVNFLSFNYTDTLNKVIRAISQSPLKQWQYNGNHKFEVNKRIVQMHGTSKEFPILGVDNSTQIANQDLLSYPNFAELMIKPQSVNAIGQLWHNEAQSIISNSRIIGVFGMSLGESDAKWWIMLIKWLKENSNRHLIVYWYTKNPPNGVSVLKKLSETKKAKDTLYKYMDLSQKDIENISNRIHIAINTKEVLNISLKKKEIIKEDTTIEENYEVKIYPRPNSFEEYDGVGKEVVVI